MEVPSSLARLRPPAHRGSLASSCAGYLCKSSFVMKEPGKYTCFVQRMNGRTVFGIGDKNSNTNQYIWGSHQRVRCHVACALSLSLE